MANKIKYGLKNVYYAVATINTSTGHATYGDLVRLPGAVNLSLDPEGESSSFFADDIAYATFAANAGYSGSLELALLPDEFRKDILGEKVDTAAGIQYEVAAPTNKPFALVFEFNGDDTATRHVFYNVTAARTTVSGQTTESSIEVQTESVNLTCSSVTCTIGSEEVNVTRAKCADKEATAYASWFTSVQQPNA